MSIIPIQSDAHWHELRSKHMGGSDVAALFGCCPYLTKLELWLIKHGDVSGQFDDNERMYWGRLLEHAIGQAVEKKYGWRVELPAGYYICDDTAGMGCTPDRIIFKAECVEPGLLQIKNVDRLEFMKWEDGQPPLNKQLQLQHELACTGYAWGALAALVGGNDLKVFEYDAHVDVIAKIKNGVRRFWSSVESGEQPPAVAEDYDTLRDLTARADEAEIDLSTDNEMPDLCARAKRLEAESAAAEKEAKLAKATILQKMNSHARARCTGFKIKATTVNKKEYVVKATIFQQLTIKEEKAA